MKVRTIAATIVLVLVVNSCRSSEGPAQRDATTMPEADTVTLGVAALPVTVSLMQSELLLLGVTVALRHVQLRAPSAGRVLGFDLQNGDRVRRGQVVAHVLNREVEAAANGLAVAQQLDPAEAPALAQAVKRYSGGGGVAVSAPEDGIVSQRLVSSGQVVNDMDPLADLVDPRSIYVEAAVPVTDLGSIHPGMGVTVTSPMIPGTGMPARVVALLPSLSPTGATSPARIEFTSDERITEAGAPVEASITIASIAKALVIPTAALFEDAVQDNYYVFVAGADGRAHRTSITKGIRKGKEVQVTSGVKAGDLVIITGGYALADGLKVKVMGAQR